MAGADGGWAPGFYGKVPARGDFIARRLPPGFGPIWEEWLQILVASARAALAEDFAVAWQEAPVWHFALGSGLAASEAMVGVVIPSVDRVGRWFPFSIFGAASVDSGRIGLPSWSARAEGLALGALEDSFDPEALDAALVDLGPPDWRPDQVTTMADADPADWPAEAMAAMASVRPREAVFWRRGVDGAAPVVLRCLELPSPAQSAAMIAVREHDVRPDQRAPHSGST